MPIKDHTQKLAGLYEITKEDWYLRISVALTEPYAPVASIAPEGSNMTRYTVWGDSVEDAVEKAVELAYREVVLGEKIEPVSPITNPDDRKEPPAWLPE